MAEDLTKKFIIETSDDALNETRSSMALMEAMTLLKGLKSNSQDIARALQFDPGISDKILQEVNSPFYGLPNRVGNLEQAISLLGFKRITDLLAGTVSHGMYQKVENSYFEMMAFKRHGMAVGCMAEEIARAMKLDNPEEFFTAGSMHDIGKYFYLVKLADKFEKVVKQAKQRGVALYLVEREMLGVDHTQLGVLMADAYQLPDTVKAAIRYHHGISERDLERLTSRETQMVEVVTYANLLAHGNREGGSRVNLSEFPRAPGILTADDIYEIVTLAEISYDERLKLAGITNEI